MTREDLKAYKYKSKTIKRMIEKYEEQRELAIKIIPSYDGLPKAKNKESYAIEELIDSYNDIIIMLKEQQKKQNEILKQINSIEEPYATLLVDKYILEMTLEEVSVDINYSYDRTCKMHGIALNMFDELNK